MSFFFLSCFVLFLFIFHSYDDSYGIIRFVLNITANGYKNRDASKKFNLETLRATRSRARDGEVKWAGPEWPEWHFITRCIMLMTNNNYKRIWRGMLHMCKVTAISINHRTCRVWISQLCTLEVFIEVENINCYECIMNFSVTGSGQWSCLVLWGKL